MNIGDTCNFKIGRDHLCKVTVMLGMNAERGDGELYKVYFCRRIDNGTVVMATGEELTKTTENK